MDIWEKLYERAKKEYHPEDVSPFIQAHRVVCAQRSDANQKADRLSGQGAVWRRERDALRRVP